MTVIDWDKTQILNYLGTYFPRSFAESVCIYSEFIPSSCSSFLEKEHLDVLDFGCGNGIVLFLCSLYGTKTHIGILDKFINKR